MKLIIVGSGCMFVVLVACVMLGSVVAVIGSGVSGALWWVWTCAPGACIHGPGDGGMSVAILSLCIFLVALLGVIFLLALWLLKGNPKARSQETDADEARMIQDIYHGLMKMEERVEALETLLLDGQRKGNRS